MASQTHQSPIDGGYSYVIALLVFLAHMIQLGFSWTMGVWYTVFMEEFNVGSKYVALISSLNTASFYAAGPLASFLTNLFGARPVCILGGLVGCIGVVLSIFVNSIEGLYVTFGLISGIGIGLSYIPGISIMSFYFEKRRSVAMGIAVSGCGIGTFLFPPIIAHLIGCYGVKGAMLVIAGIILQLVAIGALYRPWKGERNVEVDGLNDEKKNDSEDMKDYDIQALVEPKLNGKLEDITYVEGTKISYGNTKNLYKNELVRELKLNGNGIIVDKHTCILLNEPKSNGFHHVNNQYLSSSRPNVLVSKASLLLSNDSLKGSNVTLNSLAARRRRLGVPSNFSRTISICDLQPGSAYNSKPGSIYGSKLSLARNGLLKGSRSILGSANLINGSLLNDQSSYMQIQDNVSEVSTSSDDDSNVKQSMLDKLNLDIFREYSYLSLCINNLLFCFGLSIVYVHLGSYAKNTLELTIEQSGHFFSAIGIANFFGRFAFGALCQVPFFKPMCVYTVSFAVAGIVTLALPLWDEHLWLMSYAVAFGFLSGSLGALLPSVILQVTDLNKLSSAYGYLLVFEAIGTLFGAPLAGVLYDWTGVYKNSFYMGGLFMVASALAMGYPIKYGRSEAEMQRALSCSLDEQFNDVMDNLNGPITEHETTPITEESSLEEV